MNKKTFVLANIKRYKVIHFLTTILLSIAVGMIFLGIHVGESIYYSLKKEIQKRLQKVQSICDISYWEVSSKLHQLINEKLHAHSTSVLVLPGHLSHPHRVWSSPVQIWGISQNFFSLAQQIPTQLKWMEEFDSCAINQNLAQKLGLSIGDTIDINFSPLVTLQVRSPFTSFPQSRIRWQLRIAAVLSSDNLGDITIRRLLGPVYNVFIPLSNLQNRLKQMGRINLILTDYEDPAFLEEIISQNTSLLDYGYSVRQITWQGCRYWEVIPPHLFIPNPLVNIAIQYHGTPVFSYFVNRISKGDKSVPYSFVSGIQGDFFSHLKDDEVIVNQWLANELQLHEGDQICIRYYAIMSDRSLKEEKQLFRVAKIVSMDETQGDEDLMPNIPGLSNVEHCQDWDRSLPIDLNQVRTQDEEYWYTYRGRPKLYLHFQKAQDIWKNPFGSATAIRFKKEEDLKNFIANWRESKMILSWMNLQHSLLQRSEEGMNRGILVIGLSFLIITSALVLIGYITWVTFIGREDGHLLLILGVRPQQIKSLWLMEILPFWSLGIIMGGIGGYWGTKLFFTYVNARWPYLFGYIQTLTPYFSYKSFLQYLAIMGIISCFCLIIFLKTLLSRIKRSNFQKIPYLFHSRWKWRLISLGWITLGVLLIVISYFYPTYRYLIPLLSFLTGITFLLGVLCLLGSWFAHSLESQLPKDPPPIVTYSRFVFNNLRASPVETLLVVGIIALGFYLIFALLIFFREIQKDPSIRESGTGGFVIWTQLSTPMDMETFQRMKNELLRKSKKNMIVLPFRIHEADEASCLNLRRVVYPRIIGLNTDLFNQLQAFRFARVDQRWKGSVHRTPWELLSNQELFVDSIPVVADQDVLTWILRGRVGDKRIIQTWGGKTLQIHFVATLSASIFQGFVIMNENHFIDLFPQDALISGFLLAGDSNILDTDELNQLQQNVFQIFGEFGPECEFTLDRLQKYYAVTYGYLQLFSLLGIIGLGLGGIVFILIMIRRVMNRQVELAWIGLFENRIHFLVIGEYIYLVIWSWIVGWVPLGGLIVLLQQEWDLLIPWRLIMISLSIVFFLILIGAYSLYLFLQWMQKRIKQKLRNL